MSVDLFRVVLPVDRLEEASAFWSELLGLRVDRAIPNRHYLVTAGAILALVDPGEHDRMHGREGRAFRPNPDLVYFAVDDLDAAFERASALGMEPLPDEAPGIRTRPWGERSFYGRDPSGNPLCLVDAATCYRGRP